jgi:hypothetical protein
MTCVVLGGSRHISKLNEEIRHRLDRIVEQQFRVVIGDANGADKAFQLYLSNAAYRNVEVFCSGTSPRNNLGAWECNHVVAKARPGTFEFYAAKDQAMADVATVGFMLWDGESVGTILNVWRLAQQKKSCLVYVRPQHTICQVRGREDFTRLLAVATADARSEIGRRINQETPVRDDQPSLFGPDLHSVGLG